MQYSYQGLGVVLLDFLSSDKIDGYVDESMLATHLRLSSKFIRKALRYLEGERILTSESVKFAFKRTNAEEPDDPDVEVKKRQETHVFWTIDYPRVVDILRLRIHGIRELLKKNSGTVESIVYYACPTCGATYTSLQAASLIDPLEGVFKCEDCSSELAEKFMDDVKSVSQSAAISRRERQAFFKDLLCRFEYQVQPILDQLEVLKDVNPPDPGSLKDWYTTQKNEATKRAQRLEEAKKKFKSSGAAGAHEMTEEQLLEWAERAEMVIALPGTQGSEAVEPEGKELPAWFKTETGQAVDVGATSKSDEEEAKRKRQLELEYLQQYLQQVQSLQHSAEDTMKEDLTKIKKEEQVQVIKEEQIIGEPQAKKIKREKDLQAQADVEEQTTAVNHDDDMLEWEDA